MQIIFSSSLLQFSNDHDNNDDDEEDKDDDDDDDDDDDNELTMTINMTIVYKTLSRLRNFFAYFT